MPRINGGGWRLPLATVACSVAVCAVTASSSYGATVKPVFRIYTIAPSTVLPGEKPVLAIVVQNIGEVATVGPIEVTDRLSVGLIASKEEETGFRANGINSAGERVKTGPTTCEMGALLRCVSGGPLVPGAMWYLSARFEILPTAIGTLTGDVTTSGGGAKDAQAEQRMTVGPVGPFGFSETAVELLNADRTVDQQAASTPDEFVTALQWKTFSSVWTRGKDLPSEFVKSSVGHVDDVVSHLPPGMIGNPSATLALCTTEELKTTQLGEEFGHTPDCPFDSQVGIARIYFNDEPYTVPLYNMTPRYGVATELGFELFKVSVLLEAYVRPRDHGVDVVSHDTSTSVPFSGAEIAVWGDPSAPRHDRYRPDCLDSGFYQGPNGLVCHTEAPRKAFLRTPTSCSGEPLLFGAESNSYEKPDEWAMASFTGPTMTGCGVVPFSPDITVVPTGIATSSPTGVSVKLSLPQNQNPEGLATADLKKAIVKLPEGMAINPSSADGLQVCDDAHMHLDSNVPAECPDGSKIGTVLLHTQLISEPIEGSVFLRPQNSSDPMSGEMFRMAIELRDDARGLDIKVPGQVQADPATGRLTTTFDDNPQFPFEDISLRFKSGSRATLMTPASCQAQSTLASFYSWAQPEAAVDRTSSFQLTSGPEGSPCPGTVLPFAPSLNAGVSNVEAGGFTPFLTTFSRKDSDQSMQRVSVTLPPGLTGSLIGLPLCGEAQANAGTCPAASEIGSVTAGAGVGPNPFYVTGGKAFMTGPYRGAPFGLSVVVPAKAGPFDLGTVVVRSKVEVDLHTTRLTVTTDPLPQIVDGVPVALRLVNVTIDRPRFVINPTDCDPFSVDGSITGGQGTVAQLANRFQVTNCAALAFKPRFGVATSGKTSRAKGASLSVKLTYPKDALGRDANIAKVKVDLPKQLPSRLTTLQKACPASTFNENPAACPPASRVGTARAITPILPVALEGPAYFVSHGGAKFPELIVVLQGYGVTVQLDGETSINERTNITSSTFRAVPDVPVGSFELRLPQGPDSALAAIGNLCKAKKLAMPTTFVAQDGVQLHQTTKIAVTGCSKHKRRGNASRHKKSGR
jgi:hypothetical protein